MNRMSFLKYATTLFLCIILNFKIYAEIGHGSLFLILSEKVESLYTQNFYFRGKEERLSIIPSEINEQASINVIKESSNIFLIDYLEEGEYRAGYFYQLNSKYGFFLQKFTIEANKITELQVQIIKANFPLQELSTDKNDYCSPICMSEKTKCFTTSTKIPEGFTYKGVQYALGDDYFLKNGGIIFVTNGTYTGIINNKGKWLIKPEYTNISPSPLGLFFQVTKNNKIGYFDLLSEKLILPVEYESTGVYYLVGGSYILKKDGRYGVLDSLQRIVIPFEYDYINANRDYHADFFEVKLNNKSALFKKSIKLTDFKYSSIFLAGTDEYCHRYTIDGKFGFLLKSGRELTRAIFTRPDYFKNDSNCVEVTLDNKVVYINKIGKILESKNCK